MPEQKSDLVKKEFVNYLSSLGLSPLSHKNYRSDLTHFMAWVILRIRSIGSYVETLTGIVPFLNNNIGREYKNFMAENSVPVKTLNRRLSTLRHLARFLLNSHAIDSDFTQGLENISAIAVKKVADNPVFNNFKSFLEKQKVSPNTIKNYVSDIRHFLTFNPSLSKLTTESFQKYQESVIKDFSPATIKRKSMSVKKLLDWAKAEGLIDADFGTGTKIPALIPASASPASSSGKKNWYKRYRSIPGVLYLNIIVGLLLTSAVGLGIYNQFFKSTKDSLAGLTALNRPKRYLSFQGRLTNQYGNPTTGVTSIAFTLYDDPTAGSTLWTGTCNVSPDTDGIFSTILGSDCGTELTSSVFAENAAVWLGVKVATDDEATPRIQIATVAYALNSETLQGYPASSSATINTVPVLNNSGQMVIAASSPKIQSTSGTFAIEGQALTMTTPTASNGNVTIAPDGTGQLNLTFAGASPGGGGGMVNATDANLTSGALYYGSVASNASGYNLIQLQAGSAPSDKFVVNSAGDTTIAGNLNVNGNTTLGNATSDTLTFTGRVAENSSLIPIGTNGTNDLGSGALPWDNVYAVSFSQNGNLVCDSAGTNCPAGSVSLWEQSAGALYPMNSSADVLIGGSATASAKFAFKNVLTGTPTASISGSTANIATFIDGNGNISSTNRNNLVLGNSTTYNTTGNILLNPNGTGNVGIGTTAPVSPLSVGQASQFQVDTNGDIIRLKGLTYAWPSSNVSGGFLRDTNGSGVLEWTTTIAATSLPFSGLTSGTNTTALMTVGTGATFTYSGTGVINASQLIGATWAAPLGIGSSTPNTGAFTTLTTTGNVGIGTTSSLARLSVQSTGTTDILNLFETGGSEVMTVLESGNVGIGVTNPGNVLQIGTSSSTGSQLNVAGSISGTGYVFGNRVDTSVTSSGNHVYGWYNNPSLTPPDTKSADNFSLQGTIVAGAGLTIPQVNQINIGNITKSGTGTVTNSVGLNIQSQTVGTNNYAIYTNAGLVRFGDNVSITGYATVSASLALGNTVATQGPGNINASGTITGALVYQGANQVCDVSGNCTGSAIVKWRESVGALSPYTDSLDVLIGSNATASAKFAFMNVATGTPTASISGTTASVATYLTGEGNLAVTNGAHLTLGGIYTGEVDVANDLNLANTKAYFINGTSVLNATTLGTNVVTSSLTTVGALNSGSITSGFGAIDTGADNIITTGTMGVANTTTFTGNDLTLDNQFTSSYANAAAVNLTGNGAGITFTGTGANQIITAASQHLALMPGGNVGVGSTGPTGKLNVVATTEQLRLGYNNTIYNSFTVGSTGNLTIAAVGTNPNITLTPGGTGYTLLNGNVGIGTTVPSSLLSVGQASQFQVDSTGDIVKIHNLTYAWPSSNVSGGFLRDTNGSGVLEWTTTVPASSVAFNNITSGSNTQAAMTVGTGASITYSGTGVINATQLLGSTWSVPAGIGTTTPNTGAFTTLTSTSGTNLATTTGNVGVGSTGPTGKLNVVATTEQLRLGYNNTIYNSFTVGSTGNLTIAAVGTNPNITLTPGGTGYTLLNGNVGIGTTVPSSLLSVGQASQFQVDSTGDIVKIHNLTYAWPSSNVSGGFLRDTNGSGVLEWTTTVPASSVAFNNITSGSNTQAAMTVGTGASITYSGTGVINATQLLGSTWSVPAGIGTTTPNTGAFTTLTSTSGTNLATTTGNVGVGSTGPTGKLNVVATTEQLRLGYNNTIYNSFTVGSTGNLTIAAVGTNPNITLTPGGTGYTLLNGNVGIGTTVPSSLLSVGQASQFQVDSTGDIVKIHNLTYAWPSSNVSGGFLRDTNGSGVLEWTTTVPASSVAFNNITSGSNTQAAMTVGTGASITYSGTGVINATQLLGSTWSVPAGIGTTTPNTGAFTTLSASSALAANGGITFDSAADTVGAHTLSGTLDANTNIITNIGNAGTDFVATTGALNLAGVLTMGANAGITMTSGTGQFSQTYTGTTTDAMTLVGNSLSSGDGLNINSSSTVFTGNLIDATLSGSNANNTGSLLMLTNSGVNNANTTLYIKHYATGTGNFAMKVDDASGDTTPFVIDGAGSVGIGTTAPLSKLSINGGVHVGGDSDAGDNNLLVDGTLHIDGAGTFDSTLNISTATNWQLGGVAYTGTMANLNTLRDDSMADALHRHSELSASDGAPDPALQVDATGNVGIGTTAPAQKLDVVGTVQMTGFKLTTSPTLNYVLTSDANGVGTWAAAGGGTNYWQLSSSSLSPANSTYALNVGNVASTSAFFHVPGTNNQDAWFNLGTGNVGIGTTSPAQKLDVVGTVQMTGFKLTTSPTLNYVLTSDANGVGTWAAAGGGTNYWQLNSNSLSPANSTYALNVGNVASASAFFHVPGTNNQDAWFNLGTGKVGIGTIAPGEKLDVVGNIRANDGTVYAVIAPSSTIAYIGTVTNHPVGFNTNNTERFRISAAGGFSFGSASYMGDPGAKNMVIEGDVGIGTTSPGEKLEVAGNVKAEIFKDLSNGAYYLDPANTGTSLYIEGSIISNGAFSITSNATNGDITINAGSGNILLNPTAGSVGIGETSPTAKLAVVGGSSSVQTTVYSTAGSNTFTVPTDVTSVQVKTWGAGGGGGAGATTQKSTYIAAGSSSFIVPANVTSITVKAWGAGGGGGAGNGSASGGAGGGGGFAQAGIDVTPGETLTIEVGTAGARAAGARAGGNGGGFSAIKRGSTYLVQAGAGGGGGGSNGTGTGGVGGAGGTATNATTNGTNGSGATNGAKGGGANSSAGGTGGAGGTAGTAGASNVGGNGGATGTNGSAALGGGGSGSATIGGGGGGGGYYGGGGGGQATAGSNRGGGGGGGGWSYPAALSETGTGTAPANTDDGDYPVGSGTAGVGGGGHATYTSAVAGNPGRVVLIYDVPGGNGGGGGSAFATITVTPGESLTVETGTGGAKAASNSTGGSGGGYSAVKRSATYLVQAGGGGGGGGGNIQGSGAAGGAGGGTNGANGSNGEVTATVAGGGTKGTNSAGGAGGTAGTGGAGGVAGAANAGGNAGGSNGSCTNAASGTGGAGGTGGGGSPGTSATCGNGGGGGGGRYGGGGGGSADANRSGAGGGGGSDLVTGTSTNETAGSGTTAGNNGDTSYTGNAGLGGTGATSAASATAGNPGLVVLTYTSAVDLGKILNLASVSGLDRLTVLDNGNVGIGTTSPTSLLTVYKNDTSVDGGRDLNYTYLEFSPSADETMSGSGYIEAFYGKIEVPETSDHDVYKIYGSSGGAENYGTGDVGRIVGVQGWAYNDASTTVGSIRGVEAFSESVAGTVGELFGIDNWSGVYGGTVANHYGENITLDNDGGVITNRYGLFINATGTATNDYGVYQETATQKNYFAGNVGIGTTNPLEALSITKSYTTTDHGQLTSFDVTLSGSEGVYSNTTAINTKAITAATGAGTHEAYGIDSKALTTNDAVTQYAYGVAGQVGTHAGDIGYALSASSYYEGTSTGGTQYGLYIDMFDTDATRYGIYQQSNNTNYFAGNVGIGTTGPLYALHIKAGGPQLYISSSDYVNGSTGSGFYAGNLATGNSPSLIQAYTAGNTATGTLLLNPNGGNVGIGTTNPQKPFHIADPGDAANTIIIHSGADTNSANTMLESLGTYNYSLGMYSTSLYQYYTDSSNVARQIITAGNAIDLAEWYKVGQANLDSSGNSTLKKGQLLCIDKEQTSKVVACSPSNNQLIGIVSTNPYETMGMNDLDDDHHDAAQVALTGQVPLIIAVSGGQQINSGDSLTSSNLIGTASKAIQAGQIAAKALESTDWNSQNCPTVSSIDTIVWPDDDGFNPTKPCFSLPDGTVIGKIMAFTNISWYDPDVYLTNTGDLNIAKNFDGNYQLTDTSNNSVIDRIGAFGQIIAANIKAGIVNSQLLIADSVQAVSATINNLTINNQLFAPLVATKLISPLADGTDVTIQLGNTSNTGSTSSTGKLSIQNADGTEVATIDIQGNATFSGIVDSSLLIADSASVSGTFYAGEIKSKSLDEIQALLTKVQTDQNLLAQVANWNINTATDSAIISNQQLAISNLFVTNQAAINSLSVSNALTIGPDLVFQSTINNQQSTISSIDTLSAPLKLQSLAMAPLEIMAGLVTIDTKGNVQIAGNLFVAGKIEASGLTLKPDLTRTVLVNGEATESASLLSLRDSTGQQVGSVNASGSAQFNNLSTQGLTIAGADATISGTIINGVITSNSTVGKAVIPAGVSEITIKNPKVTDYTLIYVTPTSSTENNVLYVKSKAAGQFVVGFANLIDTDVSFNWWVIQVTQ